MSASYGWIPASGHIGEECVLIYGSKRWRMQAGTTWWQITSGASAKTGPAKNLTSAKISAEQEYKRMRQR